MKLVFYNAIINEELVLILFDEKLKLYFSFDCTVIEFAI